MRRTSMPTCPRTCHLKTLLSLDCGARWATPSDDQVQPSRRSLGPHHDVDEAGAVPLASKWPMLSPCARTGCCGRQQRAAADCCYRTAALDTLPVCTVAQEPPAQDEQEIDGSV